MAQQVHCGSAGNFLRPDATAIQEECGRAIDRALTIPDPNGGGVEREMKPIKAYALNFLDDLPRKIMAKAMESMAQVEP